MSCVVIPEPKINLYEDGFEDHDQLSRKPTGEKLSELVDKIEDPLVIALDGTWGSGKSFFLKCWVGEHLKRPMTTTQTVYFDAFQYDYLDDPLVALTGAISDRFRTKEDEQQEQHEKRKQKLKQFAFIMSKASMRVALSVATAGISERLNELGGETIRSAGQEFKEIIAKEPGGKEVEQFWTAHYMKIAAMTEFRDTLRDLTKPNDGMPNKLVVVVDELDRCRPDYALSLLEIIKHFFNVEGVHFILGVNLIELQNSVRARYGSTVDATTYLQKFYSVVVRLPSSVQGSIDYLRYFESAFDLMQIDPALRSTAQKYLKSYISETPMTLRVVQRILTILALIPVDDTTRGTPPIHGIIKVSGAIMKVCTPPIYEKLRQNKLTIENLRAVFCLDKNSIQLWKTVLEAAKKEGSIIAIEGGPFCSDVMQAICENYLEVFDTSALQV